VFLYRNVGQNDLRLRCATNDLTVYGLTIPIGTFSHIACTFTQNSQIFYLNGQPVYSEMKTYKAPVPPGPLDEHLASNVEASGDMEPDALVGELDELRFFSTSRSAEEIREAYVRGAPISN
jgi:hypothetical protein